MAGKNRFGEKVDQNFCLKILPSFSEYYVVGSLNLCLKMPDSLQKVNLTLLLRENIQNMIQFCGFGPKSKYSNILDVFSKQGSQIELIPFALNQPS